MKFTVIARYESGAVLATNGKSYRAYGVYYKHIAGLEESLREGEYVAEVDTYQPSYYVMRVFDTQQEGEEWCLGYGQNRQAIIAEEEC